MHVRLFLLVSAALLCVLPASAQDDYDITFLEGDAARAAIVDESVEPYFSLLCHHEMELKSGITIEGETLGEQRERFKRHYAENVRDFTDEEKEAVANIASLAAGLASWDFPRFSEHPWVFIKVTTAVEQGLPHTRGHAIVLPEGVVEFITHAHSDDRDEMHAIIMRGVELMLHEQIHVLQRLNPEPFQQFYTEHWGLVHVESIEYGDGLKAMQVINPDGVDTRWVQSVGSRRSPRYIQPNIFVARFEDRASRMPNDFLMLAVELRLEGDGVWRPVAAGGTGQALTHMLLDEPSYTAHYGPSTNIYHPNESFADLFAKLILNEFGSYPEPGFVDDEAGQAQEAAFRAAVAPVRSFMAEHYGEVPIEDGGVVED
ncbi:MAG: hypothetical protein AAGA29_07635 [Planctomycetota bacterium]